MNKYLHLNIKNSYHLKLKGFFFLLKKQKERQKNDIWLGILCSKSTTKIYLSCDKRSSNIRPNHLFSPAKQNGQRSS